MLPGRLGFASPLHLPLLSGSWRSRGFVLPLEAGAGPCWWEQEVFGATSTACAHPDARFSSQATSPLTPAARAGSSATLPRRRPSPSRPTSGGTSSRSRRRSSCLAHALHHPSSCLLCSPARFVPVNPLGSSWCMHSCRCSVVGCGSVGSWWLLPSPNSTAPRPGTTSKGLLAGTSAPSSSGTCPFPGGSTPSCVVAGPGAAQLRAVVPSQLPSWGLLCSQQLRACTLQLEPGWNISFLP